jgi:hypothetical protein
MSICRFDDLNPVKLFSTRGAELSSAERAPLLADGISKKPIASAAGLPSSGKWPIAYGMTRIPGLRYAGT